MNALHRIFVAMVIAAGTMSTSLHAAAQVGEIPLHDLSDQSVQRLIEQLESPRFSERAKATLELQRLGPAAIQPLEKVVWRGSSEAAQRALGILKRNFQSDNDLLSGPAAEALQRIAQAENHPHAQQAQRILTPPQPEPKQSAARPRRVPMPAVPMNVQIQVQVKSVNGQKEIKVKENGREFRFRDDGRGIAVERPDGKGGIKKDRYKDQNALKEKDPEAHRIYQRYAGKGNGIQIQLGAPFRPGFQIQPRIEIRPRRTVPGNGGQRSPKPLPESPKPLPESPKPAPKSKLDNIIEV